MWRVEIEYLAKLCLLLHNKGNISDADEIPASILHKLSDADDPAEYDVLSRGLTNIIRPAAPPVFAYNRELDFANNIPNFLPNILAKIMRPNSAN